MRARGLGRRRRRRERRLRPDAARQPRVRPRPAAAPRAGLQHRARRASPATCPQPPGWRALDAAEGRTAAAIRGYRDVVARLPLPEYVVALGETELAAGRVAAGPPRPRARRRRGAPARRPTASTPTSTSPLFEANHGSPARAVALARRAWAAAPSVRSADALGWALTAPGARRGARLGSARARASARATRPVLYHAGMSARAAGDRAARARLTCAPRWRATRASRRSTRRGRRRALRALSMRRALRATAARAPLALAARCRAGGRRRPPARQLLDQPPDAGRGLRATASTCATSSTRPRSRPSRSAAARPRPRSWPPSAPRSRDGSR